MGNKNKIDWDNVFNDEIKIRLTGKFWFYLLYIFGTSYFVIKAMVKAYSPALAGFATLGYLMSYLMLTLMFVNIGGE